MQLKKLNFDQPSYRMLFDLTVRVIGEQLGDDGFLNYGQ
jgi:hypothetical protein